MENKKTEVDIILPNYNSADFIDRTIKSVLNQSYTKWRLILVDDFSNTETKNKIKRYEKFKKIKIYWLKKNNFLQEIRLHFSVIIAYFCFLIFRLPNEPKQNNQIRLNIRI